MKKYLILSLILIGLFLLSERTFASTTTIQQPIKDTASNPVVQWDTGFTRSTTPISAISSITVHIGYYNVPRVTIWLGAGDENWYIASDCSDFASQYEWSVSNPSADITVDFIHPPSGYKLCKNSIYSSTNHFTDETGNPITLPSIITYDRWIVYVDTLQTQPNGLGRIIGYGSANNIFPTGSTAECGEPCNPVPDAYFILSGTIPTLTLPISQLNSDSISDQQFNGYAGGSGNYTGCQSLGTGLSGQVKSVSVIVYNKNGLEQYNNTYPNNYFRMYLRESPSPTFVSTDCLSGIGFFPTDVITDWSGVEQKVTFTNLNNYPFSFDPTKYYWITLLNNGISKTNRLNLKGSSNPNSYPNGEFTELLNHSGEGTLVYDSGISDMYFDIQTFPETEISIYQLTSTSIPESSTIPQSSVSFKSTLTNPQNVQSKLEVELKKSVQPFDGTNTTFSPLVNPGSDAILTINNLSDGYYHWRARSVDSNGSVSDWQEFGTPGNTDFIVQKPIVIVPGILGSWWKKALPILSNGEMVLDPIKHTYDNLVSALIINGYKDGVDLFKFPYDWRNDNTITAEVLANKIAEVKDICDCDKVNIVAHSMGGLVSRYYIESGLYQGDVDQLFLLGTPNDGSPDAYLAWEDGDMRDGRMLFFLTIFANYELYPELFSYVRLRPLTSLQQLLPTYNYVRDASSHNLRHYPTDYPLNTFLDKDNGLNSPSKLANLVSSGVKITNIAGENITDTLDTIRVTTSILAWPFWEHGIPDGYLNPFSSDGGLELSNGDGTVPITSSMSLLTPGIALKRVNGEHGDLPTVSWPIVLETLRSAPQLPVPEIPPIDAVLFIPISGSADIQVIDPLGRKIGKDFLSNIDIGQIPQAYYTGFQNPNMEFVAIPNPTDGDYKVLIQGKDSGSYEVHTSYARGRKLITKKFSGSTPPGKITELEFTLDNDEPEETEITPQDQTPPATTISLSGAAGDNGWYKSDVTVTLSATDNVGGVGVSKTEYSLDNGATWNTYTAPFIVATESSTNNIQYHSQDYVNNLESTHTQTFKIDKTAPATTISISGAQGANSWYTSNVQVTLLAVDNLSGISTKEYSLNNGSTWIIYSSPLTISNEGITTIQYRSKDNAGNVGTVKSQTIKIDKTAPEAKISFSTTTDLPQIEGADNVGTTSVTKIDNSNYIVKDEAGHTLKIKLTAVYTAPTLNKPAVLDMIVSSLQYDSNPAIALPITNLHYQWLGSPITLLNESIAVLKQFSVTGIYDPVKKNTVIVTTQNTLPTTQTLPGVRVIKLKTISGKLGFEY